MSEKSNIAWCDATVNFWTGCTKVSDGCKNCYAETLSNRFTTMGKWGKGAPRVKSKSAVKLAFKLNRKPWICDGCGSPAINNEIKPLRCTTCYLARHEQKGFHRRRIFSLSLGDWLDEEVPVEWLAEMLDTIRQCDQVTWILCTKRPEKFFCRIIAVMAFDMARKGQPSGQDTGSQIMDEYHPLYWWLDKWLGGTGVRNVPKNIIQLTSVENQEAADKRIPELLKIPAACHGLSMEPLLGAVDLERELGAYSEENNSPLRSSWLAKLGWIIIGGESGASARPCNVEWIRSIVAQSKAAGVATFVKQLGANPEWAGWTEKEGYRMLSITNKKGGEPSEWPLDLRVQEWPKGF